MTDLVYKSTLKKTYGLPDSWIKRLGPPDKTVPHPRYRSREMYLYARARVELFIEEHKDAYEQLLSKRVERSQRASEAAQRRAAVLKSWANEVPITIDTLPKDWGTLEQETKSEFYERFSVRSYYIPQFTMSDNAVVAYIRHNMTNYEELLRKVEGKPGCEHAYDLLKDRVNAMVYDAMKE